ncbi:YoaK family protein [Yinghuangia soli]|uniref:DUF1275 domain-containing protein n=1 Tax=Yinghuangia soli TaxID=2908204 RepID=A0AA41Q8N8_9ACTN|nr:YoaK family protein [Yinghuangia soli]MCF2532242.1 DUF1275 domain-containing protein [Yinghuangia soli]
MTPDPGTPPGPRPAGPPTPAPPHTGPSPDAPYRTATRRDHTLLLTLAALSGAVDAFAVLCLGHVFAGVMTANIVFIGAATLSGDTATTVHAAAALAGFATGAALAARTTPHHTAPALLGTEMAILAAPVAAWTLTGGHPPAPAVWTALAALAMGIQAAAWGTPSTYFTGTLVGLARTAGLLRRPTTDEQWALGRLAALATGAAAVGLLQHHTPRHAGLAPLILVLAATALAARTRRTEQDKQTDQTDQTDQARQGRQGEQTG